MGLLRTVNKQIPEDMTGVWWSTLVTSELRRQEEHEFEGYVHRNPLLKHVQNLPHLKHFEKHPMSRVTYSIQVAVSYKPEVLFSLISSLSCLFLFSFSLDLTALGTSQILSPFPTQSRADVNAVLKRFKK